MVYESDFYTTRRPYSRPSPTITSYSVTDASNAANLQTIPSNKNHTVNFNLYGTAGRKAFLPIFSKNHFVVDPTGGSSDEGDLADPYGPYNVLAKYVKSEKQKRHPKILKKSPVQTMNRTRRVVNYDWQSKLRLTEDDLTDFGELSLINKRTKHNFSTYLNLRETLFSSTEKLKSKLIPADDAPYTTHAKTETRKVESLDGSLFDKQGSNKTSSNCGKTPGNTWNLQETKNSFEHDGEIKIDRRTNHNKETKVAVKERDSSPEFLDPELEKYRPGSYLQKETASAKDNNSTISFPGGNSQRPDDDCVNCHYAKAGKSGPKYGLRRVTNEESESSLEKDRLAWYSLKDDADSDAGITDHIAKDFSRYSTLSRESATKTLCSERIPFKYGTYSKWVTNADVRDGDYSKIVTKTLSSERTPFKNGLIYTKWDTNANVCDGDYPKAVTTFIPGTDAIPRGTVKVETGFCPRQSDLSDLQLNTDFEMDHSVSEYGFSVENKPLPSKLNNLDIEPFEKFKDGTFEHQSFEGLLPYRRIDRLGHDDDAPGEIRRDKRLNIDGTFQNNESDEKAPPAHYHLPYVAVKRLTLPQTAPPRSKVRNSVLMAEIDRINHRVRPALGFSAVEHYLNSRLALNFDDETRAIRAQTAALLKSVHTPLPRSRPLVLPTPSSLMETPIPNRITSDAYIHGLLLPLSKVHTDVTSRSYYVESPRPYIGKGHLACVSFAGGRAYAKRRSHLDEEPIHPRNVKNDIATLSFYSRARAVAKGEEPAPEPKAVPRKPRAYRPTTEAAREPARPAAARQESVKEVPPPAKAPSPAKETPAAAPEEPTPVINGINGVEEDPELARLAEEEAELARLEAELAAKETKKKKPKKQASEDADQAKKAAEADAARLAAEEAEAAKKAADDAEAAKQAELEAEIERQVAAELAAEEAKIKEAELEAELERQVAAELEAEEAKKKEAALEAEIEAQVAAELAAEEAKKKEAELEAEIERQVAAELAAEADGNQEAEPDVSNEEVAEPEAEPEAEVEPDVKSEGEPEVKSEGEPEPLSEPADDEPVVDEPLSQAEDKSVNFWGTDDEAKVDEVEPLPED